MTTVGRKAEPRFYDKDGKSYRQCSLCKGPMTFSDYQNYRVCGLCNNLKKDGMTDDQIIKIRIDQVNKDYLDGKKLVLAKKNPHLVGQYDFVKKFPQETTVSPVDKKESALLKTIYYEFYDNFKNISEFNTLIDEILQAKLQLYRLQDRFNDTSVKPVDLKNLNDLQRTLNEQIRKATKNLEDVKTQRKAQSSSVLMEQFQKMMGYMHDRKQEYMGVGVCQDCNKRIIFKTEFPTFISRYRQFIEEIAESMRSDDEYCQETVDMFVTKIDEIIDMESVKDTYVEYHTRILEDTLT